MIPEVWSPWIGLDHVACKIIGQDLVMRGLDHVARQIVGLGLLMGEEDFKVAGKEDFWVAEILTGHGQGRDGDQPIVGIHCGYRHSF
uniref:Eukaryotic translation initiation factor 4B2 n=1 Tax=Rhizophora mucronata TaxID=61149 RepID=A0A2P2JXU5_RHIMU